MQTNSLLGPVDELSFGKYKQSDVEPALDQAERLTWEKIDLLLEIDKKERTFENTVLALTRSSEEFDAVANLSVHLNMVLGESWKKPSQLVAKRSSKLANELGFHEGIYGALIELQNNSGYVEGLTKPRQKLLKETIRSYERNGIALQDKDKDELKEIRSKLSDATTLFGQNVSEASDRAGLNLLSAEQLAGMDDNFINACKNDAKEKDKKGYWVQFNEPNYLKIMSECSVRKTRQDMYRVSISRAAKSNTTLAAEILKLRQRMADILGYKDYADYALEERMAKKADNARRFIADLEPHYKDKANEEFAALQDFAREFENDQSLELDASDVATGVDFYYMAKLREKVSGIDNQKLKEYFTLKSVLDNMFSTLTTLYDVGFKRLDIPGWHEDVEVYGLYDKDQSHIATVWCDWYARKGKRGGAWMNEHYVAERSNGLVDRPHLGYVCANLDPPQNDRPSLLSVRDIETIWHEFGHFMHLALSTTELKEQSMMNCKWDFVEAPSQIMENWVWQPQIMKNMSGHYISGEALPETMLNTLVSDRQFMVASKAQRQFSLSEVDLALHMDFDTENGEDINSFSRTIRQRFLPVPVYPEDATTTSFTHIFAGGYAAAYYSYKWAEAIETDLFSRFEKEGVLNKQTGRDYRKEILSRGDEELPSVLIRNFLGRDYSVDAMLRRDGVKH